MPGVRLATPNSERRLAVTFVVAPAPGAKPLEQIKVVRPSQDEIVKGIPEVKEKFRDTFGI